MRIRSRWRLGDACIAYLAVFALAPLYEPPLLHAVIGAAGANIAVRPWLILGLTLLLTGVALGAGIWVTYLATRVPTTPLQSFYLIALFAAVWYAAIWYVHNSGGPLVLWKGSPLFSSACLAVGYLSLALACSFLGRLIAAIFKDRNLVPVAALVGALVDCWGVFFGTTRHIVTHYRPVVDKLSVHTPHAAAGPSFQLGPGDYAFIGILFALVHRFQLNPARTAGVMLGLLLITAILVLTFGWSLPGIVPMALAVLLVNVREFKFQKSEAVAILVVLVILAAAAFGWQLFQVHSLRTPVPRAKSPGSAPGAVRKPVVNHA